MNIYGDTNCPNCGYRNYMFRPLEGRPDCIRKLSFWDDVQCVNCEFEYKHTDVIDKKQLQNH
jgi:rubredoxin